MKIYEILPNMYLGQVLDIDDEPGIPEGFTRTPCSVSTSVGEWVRWGNNEWYITTNPPPEPEPDPEPDPEPEPEPEPEYVGPIPTTVEPEVDIAQAIALANSPE